MILLRWFVPTLVWLNLCSTPVAVLLLSMCWTVLSRFLPPYLLIRVIYLSKIWKWDARWSLMLIPPFDDSWICLFSFFSIHLVNWLYELFRFLLVNVWGFNVSQFVLMSFAFLSLSYKCINMSSWIQFKLCFECGLNLWLVVYLMLLWIDCGWIYFEIDSPLKVVSL